MSATPKRRWGIRCSLPMTVMILCLLASCGHERSRGAKSTAAGNGAVVHRPAKAGTAPTNELIMAALSSKTKRGAKLMAVLTEVQSDHDRKAAMALLAEEFARTEDLQIEGVVTSLYGNDPCRWAHAATYFDFVQAMGFRCRPFPSEDDVRRQVAALSAMETGERRRAALDLLRVMADEQTDDEHRVVLVAMRALVEDYRRRGDEEVLDAFDVLDIGNGGFAITTCGGFYREVLEAPGFAERYCPEGPPRRALNRCVGATIAEERFESLCGAKP